MLARSRDNPPMSDDHAMGTSRPARVTVAAVLAAVALAAVVVTWRRLAGPWLWPPPPQLPLHLISTAGYAAAGAVAWRQRPSSKLGPLLLATAAATLIPLLQGALPAWLTIAGLWLGGLPALLLAVLLLSFPDGQLHQRVDRLIIGAGALLVVGLGFLFLASNNASFFRFSSLFRDVDAGPRAALLAGAVLMWIVVARTVWRWAQATGPSRRALAPVPFAALWYLGASVGNASAALGVPPAGAAWFGWALSAYEPLVPMAFLVGLLRVRFARGDVGDLVVLLDEELTPAQLESALARALGDRSLQVLYWVPDLETYADVAGRPRDVPDHGSHVTVVEADGAPLAALLHDAGSIQERELVDAVTAAARLALVRSQLQARVQAQLEDVRASRARIVEATDVERRRIERDLHDGAQQRLVTLGMTLKMAERAAQAADSPELADLLAEASAELHDATAELRELARGIHPTILTDEGLEPALRSLSERASVPAHLSTSLNGRLPGPIEATGYFLVSEALANVAKHARATSAHVHARRNGDALVIEVIDDGVGGADLEAGSGLRGLTDRVAAVGGELSIHSPRGGGTLLRAELPCA